MSPMNPQLKHKAKMKVNNNKDSAYRDIVNL